ncbi:MAG: hypothetical protein GDA56_08870 [Hormoscilla sp. GM7CHS1pb]|nr:hypothetical protein [Hormoscilla sp. GM7CHS1pb]
MKSMEYSGVFNFQPVAFQAGRSKLDQSSKIAIDSNGNVWVTAAFEEINGNLYFDSYLAKYSSNGDLVQAYEIGKVGTNDEIIGIATDSNDNAWVVGGFAGRLDLDGDGRDDLTSIPSVGFLAKYDSEGDLVNAFKITEKSTHHTDLATDSQGNVWITGYFEDQRDYYGLDNLNNPLNSLHNPDPNLFRYAGGLDLDLDGTLDMTHHDEDDSYVAKFSEEGDLLFAKNIGGSGNDYGEAWEGIKVPLLGGHKGSPPGRG